jgi:hypothetical protein
MTSSHSDIITPDAITIARPPHHPVRHDAARISVITLASVTKVFATDEVERTRCRTSASGARRMRVHRRTVGLRKSTLLAILGLLDPATAGSYA